MARRPRIHYPGAVYHVTARGVEKRDIFIKSDDYEAFLRSLTEISRLGGDLIAFCLMTNHVHLAIRVGKIPLSKMMHKILSRHASTFNEKYDRVGHLFQGRHAAYLVTNEVYLANLIRYIHQNPVRAKLASRPRDWRWSSCTDDPREEAAIPGDFDPYFGQTEEEATTLLRSSTEEGPSLDEIGNMVTGNLKISGLELRSRIKRSNIVLAKKKFAMAASENGFSTAEISRYLGLTPHAVARYLENVPNVRAWP